MLSSRFVRSARAPGTGSNALGAQDVDDLIQEVFVRVLATGAMTRFDDGQDPLPYLARAAHNLAIDVLRRRRRHVLGLDLSSACATTAASPCLATSLLPEASSERERHEGRLDQLGEYIEALPYELAVMYRARFVRRLSQRDTAELLGVTRRRVRTLEERLLAGAAALLRPDGAERGTRLAPLRRRLRSSGQLRYGTRQQ